MRTFPLHAGLLALALVALLAPAGASAHRHAIAAHRGETAGPRAGSRAAFSRSRLTVTSALARLYHSGTIEQSAYEADLATYRAARTSLKRLSGTRRVELGGVLGNVEAMAAKGLFAPSRLPLVFLTLQRNREWWTTRPLLSSGQRVGFPPSRLVWEYYPGQGIQVQWLASFGAANGYYLAHQTSALRELLGEAISLATQRGGGIAWEYMFRFDGGAPPWTSGLSQGTALQALARAWSRTHETAYLTAAQQALGIFETGPPTGVRVAKEAGVHYLEYTYARSERIVNGFVQALVGLYEYAKLTGDPVGQELFDAGDAQARAELPSFNTGAWSMYDQHSESDLSYHELLLEFLEHLCERTSRGEPLAPPGVGPIAGDDIYCTTAQDFKTDLTTPPAIELLTSTLHTRERAGVQVRLSKVSTVTLTVALAGKTVWTNRATVEGGKPRLLWVTPAKPGVYEVSLRAVDLANNEEAAEGTIVLKRVPPRHKAVKSRAAGGGSRAWAASSSWRVRSAARISPPARRLPAL
jgi:D-glucuronyl C5-epimerase C-terminus